MIVKTFYCDICGKEIANIEKAAIIELYVNGEHVVNTAFVGEDCQRSLGLMYTGESKLEKSFIGNLLKKLIPAVLKKKL